MVWVPDLALGSDALGLGSGLPRAVPSDAVVAVLDEVVPGMLLQKLVLVLALAAGGVGAARLLDRDDEPAGLVVRLVAVTVYGWNALVAERLLMGAWPVLVGYAVLPWLLGAARRWRRRGPAATRRCWSWSRSAVSAPARGWPPRSRCSPARRGGDGPRRRLLLVAAGNAPWLVAGLLHASSATSDSAAAEVFALRGEGSVPAPLAALTLGGIWNTSVQPDSRDRRAGLGGAGRAASGWPLLGAALVVAAHRRRGTGRRCWSAGRSAGGWRCSPGWPRGWWAGRRSTSPAPGWSATAPGRWCSARPCSRCWSPRVSASWPRGRRRRGGPGRARRSAAVLLPVALLPDLALGRGAPDRAGRLPGGVRRGAAAARGTATATCWCCRCRATGRRRGTTATWCWTRSAAT